MSGLGPKRPPNEQKKAAAKPKPKPTQFANNKPKDRKG